jgi:Domain of unknown function (DUF4214)
MKLIIATIAGLLTLPMLIEPANAQRQYCVVSERTNEVVCGRSATKREIDRYYERERRPRDRDEEGGEYRGDREQIQNRIDTIYREVLGRRADDRGLRNYTNLVLSGERNLARIRQELAFSNEARERINQLYREILRRNGESEGLRDYQEALARGSSLSQIRRELMNSEEARRLRGES